MPVPLPDFTWANFWQGMVVLALGWLARSVGSGVRSINRTFRRYGERLADLEDWNQQNDSSWKEKLRRLRRPGVEKE